MIKVSIITIGDEICIGQIINTNAAWMASQCTTIGAKVINHIVAEDEKESIIQALNKLTEKSDFILLTGGLGPTHDDITKQVLSDYFNDKLVKHEPTYKKLEEAYSKRGTEFLERNKGIANMPSKCKVLTNNAGAAPGMLFKTNNKFIISMPGVPAEMRDIMANHVLPLIKKEIENKQSDVVLYKTLNTIGIPESHLADLLGNPEDFMEGGTLAFLPSFKGVKLRIGYNSENMTLAAKKIEQIEDYIRKRAGRFISSTGEEGIAETVGNLLRKNKKTVSVAESCTGGMLGASFTDIPGSSDYFMGGVIVYSNDAKIKMLGVNPNTIDKFGAVSEETAIELAKNVRLKFNTDFGISVTGIAGPGGGTLDKPVGTVWLGLSDKESTAAVKYVYSNDRNVNRELFTGRALGMLYMKLMENK
ncbi:MAG: competence/damage-inducible protein A [Ignavibacteriae bacterium]|nr:competence/damage-inducible protein A [Ignavibacteriota bacterium]